ncbi:MAG TPA: hypothetical protein VHB79_03940 [Polyangiaceae bacterium]|nr:hypothetical protein [Polyangiaceae bacterium]
MRPLALLAAAAVALFPGVAQAATPAAVACVAAYERTQERRSAGDLIEARAAALDCSAVACQPFVRTECRAWQGELQSAIPSVRIEVKNAPASAPVHLLVDGKLITADQALELSLNPGKHELSAIAGAQRATKEVELAVSEKARLVELSLPVAKEPQRVPPPVPAAEPAPATLDQKPSREAATRSRALPITLGVVGVAGLVGFAVFGASARTEREQLPYCWPRCSPERIQRINHLFIASDVSLGIALASFGLATGILIFRSEPPASVGRARSVKLFRLALAPSSMGVHLGLSGQF